MSTTPDPAMPVVAQRQWIEGSDESNLGWWHMDDVDLATPLDADAEALVRQRDAEAALAALQARLDEAEKDAARYRGVRTLNPRQFHTLWERNVRGEGQFDALLDAHLKASSQ